VRLDPPYFANICFILALAYLVPLFPGFRGAPPHFTATQLLSHLAYLNSVVGKPWINPVYWSLGIEFQYYLLIGLIYPLLAASRALFRVLTISALLVPSFFVQRPSLLFVHLPLFVAGILTFQFRTGRLSKCSFFTGLGVTCVVTGFVQGPLVSATCSATALVIAFLEFGGRVLTWMGMISYSLYLMHVPVGGKIIDLGARFTHGDVGAILVLCAATGSSILAAWVLYRAVELPSQRLSSWISYHRKAQQGAEDSMACVTAT
jgi:peptidoglycan/LPS O-acetylase OafA/YrhL